MKHSLVLFTICLALGIAYCDSLHSDHKSESSKRVQYRVDRGARSSRNRGGECRYKKGPWEPCDPVSNTEQRTLTLKRGDASCEATKILTRKCKKACKYEKGEWNECDATTNTRTRIDNLKPKSDSSCEQTRTITKKCKKACRYDRQADWSRCDPSSGQKVKVLRLTQGDPSVCEPNRVVKKPCGKKNKNKRVGEDYDEYE